MTPFWATQPPAAEAVQLLRSVPSNIETRPGSPKGLPLPPAGLTVRPAPAVWVATLSWPVTVTVKLPVAVLAVVVIVRVEALPGMTGLGLKLALAPAGGGTLTLRVMASGVP